MTELFRRAYRITVEDMATSSIDVAFKATRSLFARAGTCELTLFNLSPDHRALIQSYRQVPRPDGTLKRAFVRVEAGYVDPGAAVIFQGDVRRVQTGREGPDWTTKITAGDGEDALHAARGARAFGPSATLSDVLRYAAETMGVGLGNLDAAIAGRGLDRVGGIFPGGTVVHGPVARELHHLLRSAGLEWSIQGGVLQVLPRGGQLNRAAVVLSPDTGLLETPEVGINRVVRAKALMNPDLVPGVQVQVDSGVVKGFYRVESCEYAGETRGNEWSVTMDCRRILSDGSVAGGFGSATSANGGGT